MPRSTMRSSAASISWIPPRSTPCRPAPRPTARPRTIIGTWFKKTGRRDEWILATKVARRRRELDPRRPAAPTAARSARRSRRASGGCRPTTSTSTRSMAVARALPFRGLLDLPAPTPRTPRRCSQVMEDVLGELGRAGRGGQDPLMSASPTRPSGAWRNSCGSPTSNGPAAARLGAERIQPHPPPLRPRPRRALPSRGRRAARLFAAGGGRADRQIPRRRDAAGLARSTSGTACGGSNEYSTPATRAYIELAKKHGLDVAQMAIAFALTRPFMTSVIIGATTHGSAQDRHRARPT